MVKKKKAKKKPVVRHQRAAACSSQAYIYQMEWQIQDVHYLATNIYHADEYTNLTGTKHGFHYGFSHLAAALW